MIAYLKGKVKYISKDSKFIILENNGVGFRIEALKPVFDIGQELEFYIFTYKREDEIRLIGFDTPDELELFEKLISISGIGPKAAITLLDLLGVNDILEAIEKGDIDKLKVKGVGKKTAQKIILELKGILVKEDSKFVSKDERIVEVQEALISLGYVPKEIKKFLAEMSFDKKKTSEDILKEVLGILRKV